MASSLTPLGYRGKTWIYTVQAVIVGFFGGFSAIMGPLFLCGIVQPARRGADTTTAGTALTIMSVPFLLLFAGAVFRRVAHGKPILRCYREGIAFDLIGDTGGRIPFVPALFAIIWSHISLRAFQRFTVRVRWTDLQGISVIGMPMARELYIRGEWQHLIKTATTSENGPLAEQEEMAYYSPELAIPEVTFARPVAKIATEIETVANDERLQQNLPSWFSAALA
jgi:hypothetical protein